MTILYAVNLGKARNESFESRFIRDKSKVAAVDIGGAGGSNSWLGRLGKLAR